ncbi:g9550 [Coccomyxa elongata]
MDCLQQDVSSFCHSHRAIPKQPGRTLRKQQVHFSRPQSIHRNRLCRGGCRCQAAPEGGAGKSLFNLRAWGANLVNSLLLGQEQKQRSEQQPGGDEAQQAESRPTDSGAPSKPAELRILPANAEEEAWEHWKEYFNDMDNLYEHACELESAMELAVMDEQFEEAAKLKKEYDELRKKDLVDTMLTELNAAVESEDYATAAELRDTGCAGLIGWWHSRAENDPAGHLLRIAPDFGRYTAVMYTPRDFAELKGWNNDTTYGPFGGMGFQDSSAVTVEATMQELGMPVMEIFVRRDSNGKLERQACVVREADKQGDADGDASTALDLLSGGATPHMDIHMDTGEPGNGGSFAMRISLNPDGTPASFTEAPTIMDMESLMAAAMDGTEIVQVEDGNDDGEDGETSGMQHNFSRTAATVTRMDHNNFVLSVPSTSSQTEEPALDDVNPHAEHQGALDKLREALAMSGDPQAGAEDGLAAIVVHDSYRKLPNPTAAQEEEDTPSTSGQDDPEGKSNDAWRKAASEVARLHNERNPDQPMAISGEELAKVIRSAATGALDLLQQSLKPSFCLEGTTLYSRITTDIPKTDPFTGLYLGTFGPHGPEVLQLQRSVTEDGEECVLGIKLTGDQNVPAGHVSFRAKIGRKHRRSGYDLMYPPELEISARYAGEGRVAHKGFRDARWVEGELLHFSGSNPVTKGAELGFVWVVPHERRYLILLSRIDLDDPRLNP